MLIVRLMLPQLNNLHPAGRAPDTIVPFPRLICRLGFRIFYQCLAIIPFSLCHIVCNADVSKCLGQRFQFIQIFHYQRFCCVATELNHTQFLFDPAEEVHISLFAFIRTFSAYCFEFFVDFFQCLNLNSYDPVLMP